MISCVMFQNKSNHHVEREIQRWLQTHSNIKLATTCQTVDINDGKRCLTITIFYEYDKVLNDTNA